MRLINLDELDIPGKTIMMKLLDKYEKEHPLKEIRLDYGEWEVICKRKDT